MDTAKSVQAKTDCPGEIASSTAFEPPAEQKKWIELLQHTLGAGPRKIKSRWGYRNHFCAAVGSDDQASFEKMVTAGFAERGGKINEGSSQYYRATVEGCKLAGLGPRAIKRAFED